VNDIPTGGLRQFRELSLFSGIGGGLLGSKLLGWRTIGYVEWDKYCQQVLEARIRDGYLDEAPIFGDIREFNEGGYAEAYAGHVDVISAGFPCQPFSVAGKQGGTADPRNKWPDTIRTIRLVRPRYVFLENVPGLLSGNTGYFGQILGDLSESGYTVRWDCIPASFVGAPHKRNRLWIVAMVNSDTE
jgi:DNA (cytosine-5)-methyltransferase 1